MAPVDSRELPADIYGEILSWLPAKEVLRCRTVGRCFDGSSRDSFFFATQSRHAGDDSGIFMRAYHGGFLQMILTDGCSGLPPESLRFIKKGDKRILGSRGGLVLLDDGSHVTQQYSQAKSADFCLYNPVRRTLLHVPRPEKAIILNVGTTGVTFLFGDDAGDEEDYNIVCMTPTAEWSASMTCWLYSSREAAWKLVGDQIHVGPRNINFCSPVVVGPGGRTIFLASDCGPYQRREPYIVAVDVDAGTSEILPLPEGALECEAMEISGGSSSLSLTTYSPASGRFTIWDTKHPNVAGAWERRARVDVRSMGSEPEVAPVQEFSLLNGGALVFGVEDDVYVHRLGCEGPPTVVHTPRRCRSCMCSYANTFRSLGRSMVEQPDPEDE